jgi:hypothetical protein
VTRLTALALREELFEIFRTVCDILANRSVHNVSTVVALNFRNLEVFGKVGGQFLVNHNKRLREMCALFRSVEVEPVPEIIDRLVLLLGYALGLERL